MLFHCIILISILYTTTGQERIEARNWTESEISNVTLGTSESPRETEGTPRGCGNGTWYCANEVCVDIKRKCDGVFDCEDASDEYLETCRNEKPRPLFGLILHCSSFWNQKHEFVCPETCQKSPEFCYYALMAENRENGTCILPDDPINGTYKIMPTNQTDIWGRVNFWLNYTCQHPYVMVQKTLMHCTNGKWPGDPKENGYCSEACALNKNSNFTYKCPKDVYDSTSCGDLVAIKTTVNVSRATQDNDSPAKNVSVELLCSENRTFHISTDCVQEVDVMQQNFENPTMVKMTDFESKFNQFQSNETSQAFQKLVDDFHKFEAEVRGNLTLMHTMAEKCDISLDLLLYNLQQNQKNKEEKDASVLRR